MKAEYNVPKYGASFKDAIEKTNYEARIQIRNIAKVNAPKDTGALRDGIELEGTDLVTSHAPYSKPVEFGVAPREIEAKTAKYLHFIGEDGKDVFRKKVFQKARNPVPFMRLAAREVQKKIPQIFWEVVK